MGKSPIVPAGSWIVCGGYRGYQNDTCGETKSLWPPIKYNSMPMMSMYDGALGDIENAETPIFCNLESDWWGTGMAIGLSSIRTTGNMVASSTRNFLSFPANTYNRTLPPRYRKCENLNV